MHPNTYAHVPLLAKRACRSTESESIESNESIKTTPRPSSASSASSLSREATSAIIIKDTHQPPDSHTTRIPTPSKQTHPHTGNARQLLNPSIASNQKGAFVRALSNRSRIDRVATTTATTSSSPAPASLPPTLPPPPPPLGFATFGAGDDERWWGALALLQPLEPEQPPAEPSHTPHPAAAFFLEMVRALIDRRPSLPLATLKAKVVADGTPEGLALLHSELHDMVERGVVSCIRAAKQGGAGGETELCLIRGPNFPWH